MRRWCTGHSFFFPCDPAVRFWGQKFQANVDYCYVQRRAECTSLGLEHPSLRSDSSLAAKRRAAALHVVFFFNKASEPSTRAAALCVLSHDNVATKDARWVRCSPCSLGPSPRRSTASCSLAAVRHRGCIRSPTHRSLLVLVLLRVPRTAAVPGRLCSVRFLLDSTIRSVESSNFGPKCGDLGHRILKSVLIPSDFAKSDCKNRSIFFSDRQKKNPKLGIRSHNKRP